MSTTITKRKRARKACIPCHERKRKCNSEHPCSMCTTYQYTCRLGVQAARLAQPGSSGGGSRMTAGRAAPTSQSPARRPHEARGHRDAEPLLLVDEFGGPGTPGRRRQRHSRTSWAWFLGPGSPPTMRSFAYNFGIRPEEASNPHGLLGSLISEYELGLFSDIFFSAMAPIADYMDARIYAQRCRDYYHGSGSPAIAFGAIAAGVAALGSFLSPDRHPREPELVQYAKAILDDPASMRVLGIDHIIAWAMRTFYLRATTRPNNAWIASCTVMHLCEAVGLHDEENIKKMASVAGAAVVGHDADRLRRIFWISWAGHNLLSYEFDRSSVRFRAVSCGAVIATAGSVADQFVQLGQIIPVPDSPFQLDCELATPREELFERLKALDKLQVVHPFLVVTKADLAFCFYRRVYQLKMGVSDEIVKLVIDAGNAAGQAAEQLASEGHLFWNVIGSAFQYACVLLAMDTPAASVHIAPAFKGLENLVQAADTGLTREALSMARHLLSLTMGKKRRELAQLEAVDGSYEPLQVQQESDTNAAVLNVDWGLDWDQFLFEPHLSMLGPNV
ncbi:hypothetical protein VE04_05135 [Pseudogymnoascus sp. 24MN13]|nr:hypothetical protein VE04_05135 [Pseudogymnoascus sp. 24MN13]